ncbi:hypothetical protein Clacol_000396 [Clathrus columnatus]|uniref:DUF7729 domain-containing protein n=1 Tax=Clathrus columnatus TaxID=1419009 RepID=A0AAV4ZYN5_9AGAM|nr:hypothetical protein Clacol_000396 [Clathrus columnatus]
MKFSSILNVAIFLAGVGSTRAFAISKRLSLGGINQCQNALLGVAGNSDANSCLNVQGLIGGVITLQGNTSAIPALNSWLQGLCAATPCSNATLTAIATNITSGCQSDLGSADSELGPIVQDLPSIYPVLREILCLKSTSNDTLCVSNTLLGVQTLQNSPISLNNAATTIAQVAGQAGNSSLPPNLLCTDCNKAALDILTKNDPAIGSNSGFQSTIASQCGADFLSGPSPTNVVEGTGTAAPSGTLPASGGTSTTSNNNGASATFAGLFLSSSMALMAGLYTLAA